MKRRRRLAKPGSGKPESGGTPASDSQSVSRSPLAQADRLLTLLGFVLLIGFSLWLVPRLAYKRTQAFEQAVNQAGQLLSRPEDLYQSFDASVRSQRSQTEIRVWLESLGLLGLKQPRLLARQDYKDIGLALFSFSQADGQNGLVTVRLLQTRNLELQSNWHVVDLCRPDRQARELVSDLTKHLKAGQLDQAYALTAASLGTDQASLTPALLRERSQELGLLGPVSWQPLDVGKTPWVLTGQSAKGPVAVEIHERLDRCGCLLGELRRPR